MCESRAGQKSSPSPRPGWPALYAIVLAMLTALAGVEASGTPQGVCTSVDCVVVLAGFAGAVVWTRRNRAALDLQQWCACAADHVVVRVIPSQAATPLRPAPIESRNVELPERVDEQGELVHASCGVIDTTDKRKRRLSRLPG